MKVSVRTLDGKVFQVEIEPTDTVLTMKEKIRAESGVEANSQTIIFAGKVLGDSAVAEQCGIKPNDFVVLMQMIPKATEPQESGSQPMDTAAEPDAATPHPDSQSQSSSTGITSGAFSELQSLPTFKRMVELIQVNPAILSTCLETMGQTCPDFVRLVNANQSEFLQLVNNHTGPNGNPLSTAERVTITPAEWEAVQRLTALGFTNEQAAEAYLACGKDEGLAANYLIDHADWD